MVVWVFLLLLLGQLPRIFVCGLVIESEICNAYSCLCSNTYDHELFYINGYAIVKDLLCKVIGPITCSGCGSEQSLVKFPSLARRELLQKKVKEIYPVESSRVDKDGLDYLLTPKMVAIGVSGVLVLCFGLLCPCLHAKRKETGHANIAKDLNPSSSKEDHSATEKVQTNPHRVPQSPIRVPPSPRFQMSPKLSRFGSVHLSLNEIYKATHNFSASLQIGEGGFGAVYRAQLPDGQVVAIKRAKKEHFESLRNEFSSEVKLLAKVDHRNLIKLLGYVDKGDELLIITEYVSNGTLREHLDGQRGKSLNFNQRLEISIDIAHGLTYLHLYAEKQIIHRDVKSSNILLTESYRAKVGDFGFARFGPLDYEQSHISTKVRGTVGYLDPEYMRTYQLTVKSDVYSFGVLLLEILTGRRPMQLQRASDERVTLLWAFNKYNTGNVVEMMDPSMGEAVNEDILIKMFDLAIQCAAPTRSDRPDMKWVGEQLWGIRMAYLSTVTK